MAVRLRCADRGGRTPGHLTPWPLWSMDAPRRREMAASMNDPVECRYYGRDFTAAEMALLRELIAGLPALNRHALSKDFCRPAS